MARCRNNGHNEDLLKEILYNDDFFDDYVGRGCYERCHNGYNTHDHHEVHKDRHIRIIELDEHYDDEDDYDYYRRCRRR